LRDDIPLEEIPSLIQEIAGCKSNEIDPPLWVIYQTENDSFIYDPVFDQRQTFHGFHKKPSQILDFLKIHKYTVPDWCKIGADWVAEWCLSKGEEKLRGKRSKEKRSLATEEGINLAELLLKTIRDRYPDFKPNFNNTDLNRWGVDIDLMMRIDKRYPEQIKEIIEWCQKDNFWHKNILSGAKLREQFDRLVMEKKSPKGKRITHEGVDKGTQRIKNELDRQGRKGIENRSG
jgi:hypothetical protein